MGCNISVADVDTSVDVLDYQAQKQMLSKCLAGRYQRVNVSKGYWLPRIRSFIKANIKQYQNYGYKDIELVYKKLYEYRRNLAIVSDRDSKHANAVSVMFELLTDSCPCPSPKELKNTLTVMAIDYSLKNKEHDFEEIMFVFSIILTAPIITYLEPKY